MILSTALKLGGESVLTAIDNLEPRAWQSEAMLRSATAWAEFARDHLAADFLSLRHNEVQQQLLDGRIAFYPCGPWLESETPAKSPPGVGFTMMAVPSMSTADRLPYPALLATFHNGYSVPANAGNRAGGLEYLRIMLSKQGARGYTEATGDFCTVIGGSDGLTSRRDRRACACRHAAASGRVFQYRYAGWYRGLNDVVNATTNDLMARRLTPTEWGQRIQETADQIQADTTITKFRR